MVRDGARAPPQQEGFPAAVNPDLNRPRTPILTKGPLETSFNPLRGHLSRPACSHVKQLAKQAGDRSDPGRTYVQAGFFYGLISMVVSRDRREDQMAGLQSIPSPAIHSEERAQEA